MYRYIRIYIDLLSHAHKSIGEFVQLICTRFAIGNWLILLVDIEPIKATQIHILPNWLLIKIGSFT